MGNFAAVLKYLRTRQGMTQEQLASMLNVSRSRIGMYETGSREPDLETCEAIADIFNVDMDFLMGRTNIERKDPISPPSEIGWNDFTYALFHETKALTPENKEKLLEMARFFNQQQEQGK